jgi:riboflavin kinase/FMN adenylyltransferase
MEIVFGIDNFPPQTKPVFVGLGNFDGVHVGHKTLIETLVNRAHSRGGLAAAFIFHPHPSRVLTPDNAPRLLVTPERKAELLEELGLDILIYELFTPELAKWSPRQFVQEVLVNKLHICEAFVGFNHSFGHRGQGTPEMLKEFGQEYGFDVHIIPPFTIDGEVVSSTLIRSCIEKGDIVYARKLLGHYPLLEGEVIEGEHRGTNNPIFPRTANLGINPELTVPGKGVYAARAVIEGVSYTSVVNIGSKPTFHEHYPLSIEAHILNFNRDIYGYYLRLILLDKIRNEQKFPGINELVHQIEQDTLKAVQISRQYEQL